MTYSATAAICILTSVFYGGLEIHRTGAPRGNCQHCCQFDYSRDVKLQLYTEHNTVHPDLIHADKESIRKSHFNRNLPAVLYIHGYGESAKAKGSSSPAIREAFLKRKQHNFIQVDWSLFTALPWYVNAVEDHIPGVSEYIGEFLLFLFKDYEYTLGQMYVIGYDLGAELAGAIGLILIEKNYGINFITGLAPPNQLFQGKMLYRYLSHRAAGFVDVIHTDVGYYGNPKPKGHAEFYPNNGTAIQPGCLDKDSGIATLNCSHRRSWKYYIESLNSPRSFPSPDCVPKKFFEDSCIKNVTAFMGPLSDDRLRGYYYLKTNAVSPFGVKPEFTLTMSL